MINQTSIIRQQQVLKYLGYYDGKIDGIWSTLTGRAKLKFERSGKFNPAIPSNGQPFQPGAKLPEGLVYVNGQITVPGVNFKALPEYTPEVSTPPNPTQMMEDDDDDVDLSTTPTQAFDPAVGAVRSLSRRERKKLLREGKSIPITETVSHHDGSKTVTSSIFASGPVDPEQLVNS